MYTQTHIDQQDQIIDDINTHVDKLKVLATAIGTELTNQNDILNDTSGDIEQAKDNIGVVNRKIPILMRNNDRCRICIICILLLIAVILILVLIN